GAPRPPLQLQLPEAPHATLAFHAEALDAGLGAVQAPGPCQGLEVPRETRQGRRAEAGRVRLERVRGAAEGIDLSAAERAAQRVDELPRIPPERGEQLLQPPPHRGLQLL